MDTVTIKRPVTIKVEVTDDYKEKINTEITNKIRQIDSELQQLQFQGKRMLIELEKQNPQSIPALRSQLESKNKRLLETRNQLAAQIGEINKLSVGSEFEHGTIESLQEIKVGDDWKDILGVEIVVRDDVIVDIRGMT